MTTTYRAQVQRMGDSLNALYRRLQQAGSIPRRKRRRPARKTFVQRKRSIGAARRSFSRCVRVEAELVRPIMEQINKVIDELRAEEGYSMIFDAENRGRRRRRRQDLDLTEKVLARLRAAGPPTSASRPAGAGPTRPAAPAAQQPSGVQRPKPR